MDWSPFILTFKLACITTLLLGLISIPVAYWLAYGKSKFRTITEAILGMPLVLPPTVIGFYLLLAFGNQSLLGGWLNNTLGLHLAFSFSGLVIGSMIYSFPFMVYPLVSGFRNIPLSFRESGRVLGKSELNIFYHIILPNSKQALLTAAILSFAHTIGEFGVVLMIGGNIPNETRVASIAIYDYVESLNYSMANRYSLFLLGVTFFILLSVYFVNRKRNG
ncbi:MAG: molybdate ABC transporter permease subunit [Cyclobacteriaceae bacterium]|nr:molybdate ABC transporter permease subunit [Cyclobacteriaceae bacterium]